VRAYPTGEKQIAVGLVGCGEHARENLLPCLLSFPDVRLAATCDLHLSSARAAADRFPSAIPYSTTDELLAKTQVDALVVACPPQIHASIAKQALEKNIHVFVEKPPAVKAQELSELGRLAKEKHLVTAVGHNLRFATACEIAKTKTNDPSFGRPLCIEVRYLASGPRGNRWGLEQVQSFLLSHALHAIDLLLFYFGDVERLSSETGFGQNGGVALSSAFAFKSGAIGVLFATTCAPRFSLDVTIIGDAGGVIRVVSLREVSCSGLSNMEKRWSETWTPRLLQTGHSLAGYEPELRSFFNAIRGGSQTAPSFEDELSAYRVIDQIERQRCR
jgi:predicted dehydrogenase